MARAESVDVRESLWVGVGTAEALLLAHIRVYFSSPSHLDFGHAAFQENSPEFYPERANTSHVH